jgi:hypothetical protein
MEEIRILQAEPDPAQTPVAQDAVHVRQFALEKASGHGVAPLEECRLSRVRIAAAIGRIRGHGPVPVDPALA